MKISGGSDTVVFLNNRQVPVVSRQVICALKESEVELEGSYIVTIQSTQSVRIHSFDPFVVAASKLYVDRVKAGRDKIECEGKGLFDIVLEKTPGSELDMIISNLARAVSKVVDENLLRRIIGGIYRHERFSEPLRMIVAKSSVENEERVKNLWKEELKNVAMNGGIRNPEMMWHDLLKFHRRVRREIGSYLWKDSRDNCGVYGFCSAFML
jgi:hypothetical protein